MTQRGIYPSVIVPAYNEAERIGKTLKRLDQFLTGQAFSYEILVVLDGPTDDSLEVVSKLSGEIARLHVIERTINRGKSTPSEKECSRRLANYGFSLTRIIPPTLPTLTR